MNDNVVPFPKKHDQSMSGRPVLIEVDKRAQAALDRRMQAESIDEAAAFGRAIRAYDQLISALEELGPNKIFEFTVSAVPGKTFIISHKRK